MTSAFDNIACAVLTLVAVGVSLLVPAGARSERPYVWPLENRRCLTSLFGDYRPGHFHAGIDVSTGGREGLPVRAADSGWVCRARASCNGYGKAVYVRLDDGHMAVYAHLSRFTPAVARAVEAAQYSSGSYEVDVFFEPGQIPVARGGLVGHTGQTGAGPPHLHFELRDADERPVNPLLGGVAAQDTIPPAVASLVLRPLDYESVVNGERRDLELRLDRTDAARGYAYLGEVFSAGRVGLLVAAWDRMNACTRRLTLSGAVLRVDGETLFETRFEEFGYDETDRIDTYYDRGRVRTRKEEFHRLYRARGNEFSFGIPVAEGSGVIVYRAGLRGGTRLSPGPHSVEVSVRDHAGNRTSARFDLVLDERPRVLRLEARPTDAGLEVAGLAGDPDGRVQAVRVFAVLVPEGGQVEREATELGEGRFRVTLPGISAGTCVSVGCVALDEWGCPSVPRYLNLGPSVGGSAEGELRVEATFGQAGDHLEIHVSSPTLLSSAPEIRVPELGRILSPDRVEPRSPDEYRAILPLGRQSDGRLTIRASGRSLGGQTLSGSHPVDLHRLTPGAGGVVRCAGDGFAVEVDPERCYEDLWLTARVGEGWGGTEELRVSGHTFTVEPPDVLLSGDVTVALAHGDGTLPLERVGICSPQEDGDWEWVGGEADPATGWVRAPVRYLTQFALAADLTPPSVGGLWPRDGAHVPPTGTVFRARVSDSGSGLDCASVGMVLDGGFVISEFDPELEILVSTPRVPLRPGRHVLTAWAEDRAGNRSEVRSTFWVD